ncbi:dual specificity protein phosphatase 1 isoform X3 [Cryptomeria japonica]|uniref:dual specificity protein phosphatase 1 isoform X3 n=1 Tax=Cryptomeria japonica TaxID=3369 RepID=UPI0025AD7C9E|nr:dual specificity protein phosphatase 1 isoform X3 [Cryptomeria japonica]
MASIDTRKERMAKFIRALYLAKYVKNDNIPCEIEPGLFLGSIGAAQNKSVLKSLNVTHVLLVANALEPAYPNDFKYKKVEVLDSVDTDLEQHFEECFTFIDEAKQEEGGVLVHCFAGRSRRCKLILSSAQSGGIFSFGCTNRSIVIYKQRPGFLKSTILLQTLIPPGKMCTYI